MSNSMQALKLFDNKFVADTLRNLRRCPKCRSEYSYNYDIRHSDNHVKSNRPFLFPCGHNMCENCITQHHKKLTCAVCLRPVEGPINQVPPNVSLHVRDYYDLNFYLIGELHHLRYYHRDNSNNNSLRFNNLLMLPDKALIKCSECEHATAFGNCRNCKVLYCKSCFNRVHRNSKVLQSHRLLALDKNQSACSVELPKPLMCNVHQRTCDRFCNKCRLVCCLYCARYDHNNHGWIKLVEVNVNKRNDLQGVLDSIQMSRDSLRQAQKEVKAIEMQLEEYAAQTLDRISSFFVQLHSFLQNEQRRIIDEFNSGCQAPQLKLRDAYTKLADTQNALNTMRSNIEFFQHKPPTDLYLGDVISTFNTQLERMHCQVQTAKIMFNPFVFEPKDDAQKHFAKCYRYAYKDPEVAIRIGPLYGDLNRSFQEALTLSSMDLDTSLSSGALVNATFDHHKQRRLQKKQQKRQQARLERSQNGASTTADTAINLQPSVPMNSITALTRPRAESNHNLTAKSLRDTLVTVTHVSTPEHFYVQRTDYLPQLRELPHKFIDFRHQDLLPKVISVGHCYMAYHASDKQWYRALVQKLLPNEVFKIFLVDYGMHLEVPKKRLCEIEEKYLTIPFAALCCAIHDLAPANKTWTAEANSLLIEITRNKPVRLSVIDRIQDSYWAVDLFTTDTPHPMSVRDAFLYTGLARERPGLMNFKLQPKKMAPVARINQRLSKHTFQPGETVMVTVTHVDDPQEFYVVKNDKTNAKQQMCDELNCIYGKLTETHVKPIFLAALQMCCAVYVKDVWHRASVVEICGEGMLRVRLVDEGALELVHWRQLFVLLPEFQTYKEFAFKCILANIEPLQANNYAWTSEAIKEFKQLTANPLLQLAICAVKQGDCVVKLHMTKKNLDINIGAVLVKRGHALSTDEETQIVQIFNKTPRRRLSVSNFVLQNTVAEGEQRRAAQRGGEDDANKGAATASAVADKSAPKPLQRTPIKIIYILNPGEFYIQLTSLAVGIANFHEQIQRAQRVLYGTSLPLVQGTRDWRVGEHCLVYTKHKKTLYADENGNGSWDATLGEGEWYRGIIKSIVYDDATQPDASYVVFLRDIGAVKRGIKASQLSTIDHEWNCVTNAVHRCHLACVVPSGDKPVWPLSAVERFCGTVNTFSELYATMQGKRAQDTKSMPIVLWGKTVETADPLAPSVSKYSNVNRILVQVGLARLTERIDVTQQMDRLIQMEIEEGEMTLEQWLNAFSNNAAFKAIEQSSDAANNAHMDMSFQNLCSDNTASPLSLGEFTFQLDELNEAPTTGTSTAPTAWLRSKVIGKTIFAARPTYVDYDSVIYLHDAEDDEAMQKMTTKITSAYGQKTQPNDVEVVYNIGQACIAMYHVDSRFYRAIVVSMTDTGEYNVHFIDYGNIESLEPKYMRPFAPFPQLPAFANKFKIGGICPKNRKSKFPTTVLDIVHKTLVTKVVSVRVLSTEWSKHVKECAIRFGATDAAEYLIENGYADADLSLPAQPAAVETIKVRNALITDAKATVDDDAFDCMDSDANNMLEKLLQQIDADNAASLMEFSSAGNGNQHERHEKKQIKKGMFDQFDYNEMKQQINADNLYDAFEDQMDCNNDEAMQDDFSIKMDSNSVGEDEINGNGNDVGALCSGIDVDGPDVIEDEKSYTFSYWATANDPIDSDVKKENKAQQQKLPKSRQNLESSGFDKFRPHETSSVLSHVSGIDYFRSPKLPSGITNFSCSVVSVITSTVLLIHPLLSEFEYREIELQRNIKHLVKTAEPLAQFEARTVCLALYAKDHKWYRALIRSYNPAAKMADVLYVDYFNTESVPIANLKKYPRELEIWPLRTFTVRLHDLYPNPRMREKDVRQALQNVVTGVRLHARICKEFVRILHTARLMTDTEDEEYMESNSSSCSTNSELVEIELYKTLKDKTPVYESLVSKNFYSRIVN